MIKDTTFRNCEDYLEWILKVYENKHKSYKRLFEMNSDDGRLESKLLHCRGIVKAIHGVENESIPLPSLLKLQYLRTQFLFSLWTDEKFIGNPEDNGWIKVNNSYQMKLLDENDPFYKIPKLMLSGCNCQSKCTKCKCCRLKQSEPNIVRKDTEKCSILTCKKCHCFKRQKDGEFENLLISTQAQRYLDELSDEEYEPDEEYFQNERYYDIQEEDFEFANSDEEFNE